MLFDIRRIRSVTRIPSGLPYIWQRYGKYALIYTCILLVLSFLPFWKRADMWLFSAAVNFADAQHKVLSEPTSVMIDLDAKPGEVRHKLTALLNAIPGGQSNVPKVIVIDVSLTTLHGRDGLRAALERLTSYGVKIYGAVDNSPSEEGKANERDDALYADGRAFSGLGHALLQVVSRLPSDRVVGYYPITESIVFSGSSDPIAVPAMAMLVSGAQSRNEEMFFWTGPRTLPKSSILPSEYFSRTVIIGNDRTQSPDVAHLKRSSMELLAWAIDDATANPTALAPFFEVPIMWLVTAFFSSFVVLAFVAIWKALKTRPFALPLTCILALSLTFAAMFGFDTILFNHNLIFTELTFVVIGIITGAAIAYVWCFETMRHEQFLTDLWAKVTAAATGDESYDVFISYARTPENLQWVEEHVVAPLKLAKRADGTALRIFFDNQSIKTGADFYDAVVKGIYSSRYFVPIYSTAYFNRYYCRDEIALAMLRRKTVEDFILPLSRLRWMWLAPRTYKKLLYISVEKQPNYIDEILRWVAKKGTV